VNLLTCPASLPRRLYILLALISSSLFFYYEQSFLSIYWTDFHNFFHQMEGISVNFLDQVKFFSDFSRDVAMATNLVAKMGQNYLPPALIALSIRNGMGYRYINVRVNSTNDASILCKNFVNCGPVTPKKTGLICVLFYDMAKNWHI